MYTEQQDILKSQTNAEEAGKQNSSNKLIDREPLEGTPFTIIKDEEGWMLVMGKYALTTKKETREELTTYIQEEMWNTIVKITVIIIETILTENKKEVHQD